LIRSLKEIVGFVRGRAIDEQHRAIGGPEKRGRYFIDCVSEHSEDYAINNPAPNLFWCGVMYCEV